MRYAGALLVLLLTTNGAGQQRAVQQAGADRADGVYLVIEDTTAPTATFQLAIMTNSATLESASTHRVERRFPLGSPLAFLAVAGPSGRLSARLEVVKAGAAAPHAVSVTGLHVSGEALNDVVRASAFE